MTNINTTVCGLLTEDEQSAVRLYFKLCDMYDIAYAEGAMTKRVEQQPPSETMPYKTRIESVTGDPFDAEAIVEVDTRKRGPYKPRTLKESLAVSDDGETEAGPISGPIELSGEEAVADAYQRDRIRKAVDIMCDRHHLPRSVRRQAMRYASTKAAQGYLSIEVKKRDRLNAATARPASLSESED